MASDDERTPDGAGETGEELGGGDTPTKLELDGDTHEGSAEGVLGFGSTAKSEASEAKSDREPEDASDTADDDETEAYDPTKIPPLSERAMLFGAWGCVGLFAAVVLVFFVLIKSAIDKIDDYGAVTTDDSDEPQGELPLDLPVDAEPRVVTRTLEWATAYPEARAAARVDMRPMVIVFTAEYATESVDAFDGVFTNDDVESFLERYYQVVHIDMGAQGAEPDPSIALCGVEFLPHVCYVNPETEVKLGEDTTGMVSTSALLRDLGAALSVYEASTEEE